jgi:hypothetical protein
MNKSQFKYVINSHLKEPENWRFPDRNIVSQETIKCDECDKILVEVLDKDRDGNPILNANNEHDYRKYPVYIKERTYYKTHGKTHAINLCVKCYDKEKENTK